VIVNLADRGSRLAPMRELGGYLVAGVVYVVLGLAFPSFLFSWVVAAAYLLVAIWLVPAGVRRWLR
jgi:membrane protein implicated in regulation of membrane protease activity